MAHCTSFAFLIILSYFLSAQSFTITGTMKDAANGEDIFGALIGIAELPGKGTAPN
jgi:hypothetical protein